MFTASAQESSAGKSSEGQGQTKEDRKDQRRKKAASRFALLVTKSIVIQKIFVKVFIHVNNFYILKEVNKRKLVQRKQ